MSAKILIADDDASIRLVLSQAFSRLGYQVRATSNAATLVKWIADGEGDLVVTDVLMPDESVFNVMPQIRRQRPKLPVIVMSAQNTLMTAVSAAEFGVYDYLPKPFDLDDMVAVARRALARPAGGEALKAQARAVRDEPLPLIGRSGPMQGVYRTLARLVTADLTVLISGESGSGKSLAARALHDLSRRREGRFVAVNLGAAPRERIESELFGDHGQSPAGKLAEADGGTLLLEEIGDLPLDSQIRLLRVFEGAEPAINPRTGRHSEVRVVATTSRDLRALVTQGLFRQELFFRLNVAQIHMPPLCEHAEDIADLARAFLLRANREGLPSKTIDAEALERLRSHDWPGNVRELENLMRRICALYPDETITGRIVERELIEHRWPERAGEGPASLDALVERHLVALFASQADGLPTPGLYGRVMAEVERPLFQLTLDATRGNQVRAAEILGLNRNTLRKRIAELGLQTRRPSGK